MIVTVIPERTYIACLDPNQWRFARNAIIGSEFSFSLSYAVIPVIKDLLCTQLVFFSLATFFERKQNVHSCFFPSKFWSFFAIHLSKVMILIRPCARRRLYIAKEDGTDSQGCALRITFRCSFLC